jgi:hypothetical protein
MNYREEYNELSEKYREVLNEIVKLLREIHKLRMEKWALEEKLYGKSYTKRILVRYECKDE